MKFEIHVLSSDRHKNVAGLNRLLGSETSRLDNRKKDSCDTDYIVLSPLMLEYLIDNIFVWWTCF